MPVQIILIQMNLPQVNFTRGVETSTSDMSAPELHFKSPNQVLQTCFVLCHYGVWSVD